MTAADQIERAISGCLLALSEIQTLRERGEWPSADAAEWADALADDARALAEALAEATAQEASR